ncbi:MAG: L-seryl-tRNA(Sec) selenium transferase, partial [Actinomycetota bacterium]
LLGGPQAGVLVGRGELVELCRRNPIARAVRADKMTLAAMEATALAHARGSSNEIPAVAAIGATSEEIRARAERIVAALPSGAATVEDGESVTGGGSLPGHAIASRVIAITSAQPDRIAAALRRHDPPVIARVDGGRTLIDLRTVARGDDEKILAAIGSALSS